MVKKNKIGSQAYDIFLVMKMRKNSKQNCENVNSGCLGSSGLLLMFFFLLHYVLPIFTTRKTSKVP